MSDALTIQLSKRLADALQAEAKDTGIPEVEILRQALETRLKQERSQGKSSIERFAGILQGPPDLSTNKEYKKRWGRRQNEAHR